MIKKFVSIIFLILIFLCFPFNMKTFAHSIQPKVSIIIPIYNAENYLEKSIDSILNQTLKDIEIICINDCSTDNSLAILRKYAKIDNRIKIIEQKENKGAYVARNKGLELANGEYIGFVDADDYIEKETYEISYNTAKQKNSDIVVFGGKTFQVEETWADKELTTPNITYEDNSIYALLKNNGARLQVWNKIYRKSMLNNNMIKFREGKIGLDTVFNFRVFPVAKRITFIPNKFYHWRKGVKTSISNTKWEDKNIRYQLFIDLFRYTCEDWRKFNYIKGNEKLILEYVVKKFGFYPKINTDKRGDFCKQLMDILSTDVFNNDNILKLDNITRKKLILIENCANHI